jgi:hypothetical protein
MVKFPRTLALTALIALVAPSSQAAFTTYSDRSNWEASVATFDLEDFESTPVQNLDCPQPYGPGESCPVETRLDAPKLDIVLGAHGHGRGGIYEPGEIDGSREFEGDLHGPGSLVTPGPLFNRIEFEQPISALAIDLWGVFDIDIPAPMIVSILGESFPLAAGTLFFGVSSDASFSEVTLTADPERGTNYSYRMDNVAFVPTPEPGSFALVGLGLGALALIGQYHGDHSTVRRRRLSHRSRRASASFIQVPGSL